MEIKGEGEVTQIGLIFLGLNLSKFWFNWSKLGLNFGLIGLNFEGKVTQIGLIFLGLNCLLDWSKFGLNFGLIGLNFPLDWSKISSTVLKRKKETSTAFEQ